MAGARLAPALHQSFQRLDWGWRIAWIFLALMLLEMAIWDISISHVTGLVVTLLGYVIALKLNAMARHQVDIPSLFQGNISRALKESFWLCLALLAIAVTVKLWIMTLFPHTPFFAWHDLNSTYVSYLWVAPLQELTVRGILQTQLTRIIPLSQPHLYAIVGSNIFFALFHIFHSPIMALASFLIGALCGMVFYRHKNILGVSLLHVLFGNVIGLLGFWTIISA